MAALSATSLVDAFQKVPTLTNELVGDSTITSVARHGMCVLCVCVCCVYVCVCMCVCVCVCVCVWCDVCVCLFNVCDVC
jgi:hypothetical protein